MGRRLRVESIRFKVEGLEEPNFNHATEKVCDFYIDYSLDFVF